MKHKDEIELLLTDNTTDILAVNETRLDSTVDKNLIQISEYGHERCDRSRQEGVVLVYIKDSINYEARSHLPCSLLELTAIEIKPNCSKPFLLLSRYRPPNYKSDDFEQIETVDQVLEAEGKESIILGDTNCNDHSEEDKKKW